MRITRSQAESVFDKKLALIPCGGSIFIAEVADEEDLVKMMQSHLGEKYQKDKNIPGYV